jgi:hypothetical protein
MLSFGGLGFGSFTGSFTAPDLTAPTLVGQPVIGADGLTITATYSEALDPASVPTLTLAGTDSTVASVNVTGLTVVGTLNTAAFEDETITVSSSGAPIQDLAGNDAAALVAQAVTNNSEVEESISELIETLTLATDAYAESIANLSILRGSNPVTNPITGDQYFAYHADNLPSTISGKVAIGKITPANVVTVDKSAITTDAQDSHNFFSLIPDGDGDILVSGDLHGDPMNFHRFTGGSIDFAAWDTPPIEAGATNEASVTYPMWAARLANGDVLLTYRDGGSGDGNLVLKLWKKATKTLATVALIVNGNADGKSFYPHVPYWDEARQRLHCGGCWRDTSALNTNHDQIHFWLESSDGWTTATAKKAGGAAQTLPVTVANAAYAATYATNTGLTNVGSITIGSDGHPRMWSYRDPGDGISQIFALRYNGTTWLDSLIPDDAQLRSARPFTIVGVTGGADHARISSPRAICDGTTDRTIVLMRSDTQGTGAWALICERADLTQWSWKLLDAGNVGFWFGAEDYVKWRSNGEIHTLLQRCAFPDETGSPITTPIGPQTLKRLRFRPKSDDYTYTPPPALFNPDAYSGCIAYLAPRIGGIQVYGKADSADIEKVTGVKEARAGTALFTQATLSDAPQFVWNRFAGAPNPRAGILFDSAASDYLLSTDATQIAAMSGVNTPLICTFVWETTTVSAAGMRVWSACASTTHYLSFGTTASKLPTFERNIAGTVKQYTGSAGALADNTKYVITCVFDGTNAYIRVNGVQQGAAVLFTFAGSFAPTVLSLGCRRRSANDLYMSGYLGAMRFGTVIPSAGDIIAIENALAAEHAITF